MDFKQLAGELLSRADSLLFQWLPDGKINGSEFTAINPRRADKTPGSFKISIKTGIWADFAAGDKGSDLISLYAYLQNMTQIEAARELAAGSWIDAEPKPAPKGSSWTPTGRPGDYEASRADMEWTDRGTVARYWTARDEQNRPLFYDVRFEKTNAAGELKKDVLTLSWCKNTETGREAWKYKAPPEPRPLFGANTIAEYPEHTPIVIVEGAKCREALADLIGDKFPIVTWPGGAKAVKKADWKATAGRSLLIWPDADDPGIAAAEEIAKIASANGSKVYAVQPHENAPAGFDCADLIAEGADRAAVLQYMRAQRVEIAALRRQRKENSPPDFGDLPPNHEPPPSFGDAYAAPFRVLGHDRENYFYLPKAKGQIVSLRMSAHNKAHLLSLAPLQYWESAYPSKAGAAWNVAQDDLMREADQRGPFTRSRIRGRGAWRDGSQLVVHAGDRLIVEGRELSPPEYESAYIYEKGIALANDAQPAPAELGRRIVDLCKLFPFVSPVHAILAAGWSYLAPICGSLTWRPHIWIIGEAGSGKSWFRDNVIAPFVKDFGLIAQGSTSAAGIRQALGSDALPVLFDEAESNDRKGHERIAEVLELMRQSSTIGESQIIKGGSNGESSAYAPSSSWALSSVASAIRHQADQGRVSILELLPWSSKIEAQTGRTLAEQHRITADQCAKIFTPGNCAALRARAFSRIAQTHAAIEVFRDAAAQHFGNQRAGDQIGTLIAGAFCLASDATPSRRKALEFIQAQAWTDVLRESDAEKDHDQLLRYILQHLIRVQTPADGSIERTIGQLTQIGFQPFSDSSLNARIARDVLSAHGITLTEKGTPRILISPKHRGIERILTNTPWTHSYAAVLSRAPGVSLSDPRHVLDLDGKTRSRRLIQIDLNFAGIEETQPPTDAASDWWAEKEGF
jgi:putative DNA primase/helicase